MEIRANQIEKRSWVEVNLTQLRNNLFRYKKSLVRDVDIMAVIKANAYGHGDVQVARMLENCGVRLFAVSNIDEAVGLREAGIHGEILILGYTSPFYAKTISRYDLTQAIVSEDYAASLSECRCRMKCQFAIDTGMNRIGLNASDPVRCESIIRQYSKAFAITGVFTHLCVSDSNDCDDVAFTKNQILRFKKIVELLEDLHLPYNHCFNSSGGIKHLDNEDSMDCVSSIVRLGIVLYGLKPDESFVIPEGISSALTWKSAISMVKSVPKGVPIGYGRSFTTQRDSRIATVTTGYADGFNRKLSNKGFVMINGQKAPIVGRICMDQTMVDVTDIPNVKMGDKVVLIGKCGDLVYTADDMAKDLGTIGYEVVCDISQRVQRFYTSSNMFL